MRLNESNHHRKPKSTRKRGSSASRSAKSRPTGLERQLRRHRSTSARRWKSSILTLLLLCLLFFFGGRLPEPLKALLPVEVSTYLPTVSDADSSGAGAGANTAAGTETPEMLQPPPGGTLTVDFLDVGQGLSVLVNSDGHYLLFDGGDRTASSFVVAYLKKQGVESLDYLIASHYDADHLNGLVGALNVFPTKTILAPDYETDTKVYQSFLRTAQEKGNTIVHPATGSTYQLGDAQFTILAPSSESYGDENDYSVVIRLTYGGSSFLITGDAGEKSELEMLDGGFTLKSDVLCLGHHGSSTASSAPFLKAVSPDFAVISCGTGNSYGHPHEETLERLKGTEAGLFRTDLQGTLRAVTDGETITWSAEPCNDFTPGE